MATRHISIGAAIVAAGLLSATASTALANFDSFFDIDVECRGRAHVADVPGPGGTATVPIEIVALSLRSVAPVNLGGSSQFNVDSFFDVTYRLGPPGGSFNVDSFFDVSIELSMTPQGPANSSTRSFDTEMVALSLASTGNPGVVYRVAMTGVMNMEVRPDGSLGYIDSFFDVFTEVSYDDGTAFAPTSPPAVNVPIAPEPTSMALLGLGGLALLRRRA